MSIKAYVFATLVIAVLCFATGVVQGDHDAAGCGVFLAVLALAVSRIPSPPDSV